MMEMLNIEVKLTEKLCLSEKRIRVRQIDAQSKDRFNWIRPRLNLRAV